MSILERKIDQYDGKAEYVEQPSFVQPVECCFCGTDYPNLNYIPILVPCGHQKLCENCLEQQGSVKICLVCGEQYKTVLHDLFKRDFDKEIKDYIPKQQLIGQ